MNIVVYGCDNSGKTSLAKHIEEKFGFKYVRSLGPNKTIKEYLDYLADNLDGDENSVFDRFSIIEEYVNGNVLRGKDQMEENYVNVNQFLDQVDLFIYANPPMESVKNFGDREQMEGIIDHIDELREMFRQFTILEIYSDRRPVLVFDWTTDPDYKKIDAYLDVVIGSRKRMASLIELN